MRKGIVTIFFIFLAFSRCQAETIKFLIEGSPYCIRRDLVIKEGDIFTVEPGVVIEMAKDASIIVEGRIDISGYPKGGEVIFKAVGPPQNYHKGFWHGIIIKSKEKNVIQYAVIQHSKIGIKLVKGSCANLSNNIITQNKTGIRAEGAKELFIARNSFLGNFTDIELYNTASIIKNNFFQGSLIAIKLNAAYPQIKDNYFKQVYKTALEADNGRDFHCGENWWGSANAEKIQDLISQKGKGRVNFEPFLEKAPDLKEAGVDLKE